MVLAAGVGSRLDPLTSQIPKPLVPIANTPVLEHILNLLRKHGFTDVHANLHYLPEKLIEYFKDGSQFGVKLSFLHEQELSGDAGGVRACRKHLERETFVVVMGDLLTDADLSRVVAEHKMKKALATIAIKQVEDVSRFGVVVQDESGFVTGFQEKPDREVALSDLASTGIYVLEPQVFDFIPAHGQYGFGRQLFPSLVGQGLPVLGVEIKEYWSDVGTIPQYRESNFDALEGRVKVHLPERAAVRVDMTPQKSADNQGSMWVGESSVVESLAGAASHVMIGKNARVEPGVTFSGRVIIGDRCRIEKGATITDSVIWSGTHVEAGAVLRNCVLGANTRIERDKSFSDAAIVPSGQGPGTVQAKA